MLSVRLTPKSSTNAVIGLRDAAGGGQVLAVKVTAPPDKGKANAALLKTLAKYLGLPPSQLALNAGHSSRNKEVLVRGDTMVMMATIDAIINKTPEGPHHG